jgi:hypothetical protein
MTKKSKDLQTSKPVKGGVADGLYQDNITLVRAAKPTSKKKDLPTRKDVKGGQKVRE